MYMELLNTNYLHLKPHINTELLHVESQHGCNWIAYKAFPTVLKIYLFFFQIECNHSVIKMTELFPEETDDEYTLLAKLPHCLSSDFLYKYISNVCQTSVCILCKVFKRVSKCT